MSSDEDEISCSDEDEMAAVKAVRTVHKQAGGRAGTDAIFSVRAPTLLSLALLAVMLTVISHVL